MKRNIYANTFTVTGTPFLKNGRALLFKIAFAFATIFSFGTSQAQTGEALNLDGTDDRVDLPFVVSGSYTKEAWVKPSSVAGFPNILTGTNTALFINNGQLAAGHNPGGFSQVINPTPASISAGVWTHIAVTYDNGTGIMNLYQNGALVASAAAPSYTETSNRIGTFSFSNFYSGDIDEVRFWSVARTGAEIAATMNCALTGDEPFLTAYYNFEVGIAGGSNPGETTLPDVQDECAPDNGTLVNFALTGATSNWVAPGATISTNCPGSYENINVTGNAVCIESGDATPSLLDYSDFGDYGYNSITRQFVIQNTGTATLNISGATITGVDAADFTITTAPAATVAPGDITTIEITFNPTGAALTARNATVTINNSDPDEAAYTFAITGFRRAPGETLSFDGINDSVYLPVRIHGSYTKEAWINTSALTGFPNIISGDSTALFLNNGRLAAGHYPGFGQVIDNTLPAIVSNTWVHIAVTYDSASTTMNLYRDGVLVASNNTTPSYADTLQLGTFASSNFYAGLLDEVRIWTVARTGAEIAANMNCGLSGDEFFLLAYYKFNQGAAGGNNTTETMLRDSADKCIPLDGVLHNFALVGGSSNWVEPGISLTGGCAPTFENIAISGLGNCIVIHDATPTPIDGTDFGIVDQSTAFDRTFTITNTGTADLTLTAPLVISGADAGLFTILTPPAVLVAPGASTTFTVRFLGSAANGTFNATVTALNTDQDEVTYDFAITVEVQDIVPVTLLSFNGILKGSVVNLQWKTSAEFNNRGFEVLRSNSAQTKWDKVGFVAGTNASTQSTYTLNDYAPLKGINVYKLRQLDIDGRATYSDIVVINNTDKSTVISAYPNPFQQTFTVIFNDPSLLNTVAKVRSVTGNTVATLSLNNYRQEINLSKVAPGMYFISFNNGEVIRLVKQ